jgi:hypothetical protein
MMKYKYELAFIAGALSFMGGSVLLCVRPGWEWPGTYSIGFGMCAMFYTLIKILTQDNKKTGE